MGAYLLGFIVVGPMQLDVKRIPDAVATVTGRLELLQAVRKKVDAYQEDETVGFKLTPAEGTQCQHLYGTIDPDDLDCQIRSDVLDLVPERFVQKFVENWPLDGYRDVMTRPAPHDRKQVIVAAGELSWGDEPDGAGYCMLRDASTWGILEVFDIQ